MRRPEVGAIAVYLHVTMLGPVLISGFWSILSERFDPRTAKKAIGRIAGVGTLGGLAGGVLAERMSSGWGVAGILPVLAIAHLVRMEHAPKRVGIRRKERRGPLAAARICRNSLAPPHILFASRAAVWRRCDNASSGATRHALPSPPRGEGAPPTPCATTPRVDHAAWHGGCILLQYDTPHTSAGRQP